jgi:hypothetical protein
MRNCEAIPQWVDRNGTTAVMSVALNDGKGCGLKKLQTVIERVFNAARP